MLAQEVIRRKRDGHALTPDEITAFVQGLTDGSWSEGQAAALAMAVFLRGMAPTETVELTRAMTHSGRVMDWSQAHLPGPVLDKHSTGGVGDKVSLMLGPMVAACGGFVPMISGRGLGHTGGTLDKFDSIPGYQTAPDLDRLQHTLQHAGCAIIGQTADLAPADRRLYAIRDVTATVESIPLITASILSKKLAAGLQGLVMDVKVGNGAFADHVPMAQALARSIVEVAAGAGLPARAWITDMNQVLGDTVGNALEMHEALAFLQGTRREPRLLAVTRQLCAEMLHLGALVESVDAGLQRADDSLSSGRALEHFARMVASLGGPADFCDRPAHYLRKAPVQLEVRAPRDGFVASVDTRAIGLALIGLGGGRRKASDSIDASVGMTGMVPVGQAVHRGDCLALVHAATDDAARACAADLLQHIRIGDAAPTPSPLLVERIGG
ncbi:thymidine phosphorylase [Curvibacter sp. APW13]|uniref:thymidine phosphorylase n=1 Tax=Curvibacter sp. APW13 TaxID=3077236 RepID=UPI0028DD5FB0|nr:thymidine phosphorylase [Curvibacter sp. APW13]MDT8992313.1 thymidine phosphorylase [Curvibacter sp. APW13]